MIKDYQKETGKDLREQAKAKDVAQKIISGGHRSAGLVLPKLATIHSLAIAEDDAGIISEPSKSAPREICDLLP